MTQPSRVIFWRLILGIIPAVALLAVWQLLGLAHKLGIASLASKSWLIAMGTPAAIGLLCLSLLALTWSPRQAAVLERLEWGASVKGNARWLALPVWLVALTAYSFIIFHTYYTDLLRSQDWVLLLLFLVLSLVGTQALVALRPEFSWPAAYLTSVLLQLAVYRIALYLPDISAYPFSMGWSETSRFYWPSLFVSQKIYGQSFPWPILHPTLHLVLIPPYLLNAPLWFHRFWQVAVRFILVGLIAPALISRLRIDQRLLRWLFGVWIFVYLFTLPLYLHLAVPVCIMLWGFSATQARRGWIALVAASIWAGLSRINWYPVPGVLAAVLFALEVPYQGSSLRRYLLKPALWFVAGTGIAFAVQRFYIALSGIPNAGDFYTSLTSSLLWGRLWPNASYSLGVLPGALIFSSALWLVIGLSLRARRPAIQPVRAAIIGMALLVLFVGGAIVSVKIGGGADLHNMDAYAVLLLIVAAYLFFGACAGEDGLMTTPVTFHWSLVALLVVVPAWFILQATSSFMGYDPASAASTLTALQQRVNTLDLQRGQILFITQRHLIAMHMLSGASLIPEYEREELMEMAMADNQAYLDTFYADLKSHRFAAIVVDPLQVNYLGSSYALGEENDAWDRHVAKPILCNYQLDSVYPNDHVAIYVPQTGTPRCP